MIFKTEDQTKIKGVIKQIIQTSCTLKSYNFLIGTQEKVKNSLSKQTQTILPGLDRQDPIFPTKDLKSNNKNS